GFPEHPRDHRLSRRCAETRQARPRTAAGVEEPPASRTSRRRQAPQGDHGEQGNRLNSKLRASRPSRTSVTRAWACTVTRRSPKTLRMYLCAFSDNQPPGVPTVTSCTCSDG